MGPKITIDSSTLMNKGLEVIEAHELFGVPYDAIDVVVHPQSVVHSMVEFTDGSTIAQLSMPDMRLPIGYALGWPDRIATPFGRIDWATLGALTFEPPDRTTFRCLDLAYQAGRAGGTAPAWLSAANEVAVESFLEGEISWQQIADVCNAALDRHDLGMPTTVDEVVAADRAARRGGARRRRRDAGGAMRTSPFPPPQPGTDASKRGYDRFRNEVMAGGSVTERDDESDGDGAPASPATSILAGLVVIGLFAWLAFVNIWMFVFAVGILISVFLHETGHFVTARMTGMKATQFFLGFGPRLWSFTRGETEYGAAGPADRRVRPHHRHEQPRRGAAAGRGPHVPPGDVPAPHAGDHRRVADAPPHRGLPAVHDLRRQG